MSAEKESAHNCESFAHIENCILLGGLGFCSGFEHVENDFHKNRYRFLIAITFKHHFRRELYEFSSRNTFKCHIDGNSKYSFMKTALDFALDSASD